MSINVYLIQTKVLLLYFKIFKWSWLSLSAIFQQMNVFFCLLFNKCIIKQLLNSVFALYHELLKPCVRVTCLSLRLRQITQTSVLIIHDVILNLIQ